MKNMKKTIDEMDAIEKLDLLECCYHKLMAIKCIVHDNMTKYEKETLGMYIKDLNHIIFKIKETIYVTN